MIRKCWCFFLSKDSYVFLFRFGGHKSTGFSDFLFSLNWSESAKTEDTAAFLSSSFKFTPTDFINDGDWTKLLSTKWCLQSRDDFSGIHFTKFPLITLSEPTASIHFYRMLEPFGNKKKPLFLPTVTFLFTSKCNTVNHFFLILTCYKSCVY